MIFKTGCSIFALAMIPAVLDLPNVASFVAGVGMAFIAGSVVLLIGKFMP